MIYIYVIYIYVYIYIRIYVFIYIYMLYIYVCIQIFSCHPHGLLHSSNSFRHWAMVPSSSMASAPKCTARPWALGDGTSEFWELASWPFGHWKSKDRNPQLHRTSLAKNDTISGFLTIFDSARSDSSIFLVMFLGPAT